MLKRNLLYTPNIRITIIIYFLFLYRNTLCTNVHNTFFKALNVVLNNFFYPLIYSENSINGHLSKVVPSQQQIILNCPARIYAHNWNYIKLIFLSSNKTSIFQPLDQKIIQYFKVYYRLKLLHCIPFKVDQNIKKKNKFINGLDSIFLIEFA